MRELLELADEDAHRRWDELRLGYTESPGDPALRAEIAGLYEHLTADDILVFAGAERNGLRPAQLLLGPGDHAIVVRPAYQSLAEVARAAGGGHAPGAARPGRLASGRLGVRAALRANTRLILGQRAAQPDRLAERPGQLSIDWSSLRPSRACAWSSTRSTGSSNSIRRTGSQAGADALETESASASCPSRSPWPDSASAGWRRVTTPCWSDWRVQGLHHDLQLGPERGSWPSLPSGARDRALGPQPVHHSTRTFRYWTLSSPALPARSTGSGREGSIGFPRPCRRGADRPLRRGSRS